MALADEEHHRDLVLIESMVRKNYSECEISAALGGRYSWDYDFAAPARFVRRTLDFFRGRRG
jgi:hypothetical protein